VKKLALCLFLMNGCSITCADPVQIGTLQDATITEASGLAVSFGQSGRLWALNDSGSPPILFAFAYDGTEHGSVLLTDARNIDWEDLAAFESGGQPRLLIADIGDNLGIRDHVTLYIVDEPGLPAQTVTPSGRIDFRYPDGPRDAEAMAVDTSTQLAYVLSKRTIPAELYAIPLAPGTGVENELVTATFLGTVATVPQPTAADLDRAFAEKNWFWQPTAMDFAADGKSAVILTYQAAYLYRRQDNEPWLTTLQRPPLVAELGSIKGAEAAVLDGRDLIITVEARNAPLYRIEYRELLRNAPDGR
jgi:hypothetical protein